MKRRLVGFLLAVFITVQMVVTSMFPAIAYADEMPNVPSVNHYWQPSDAYTIKYVSNRFDAALALIDKWSSKIQITEPMYRKLSNEGSGGDFYDLAQMLTSVAISGEPAWASPTSNFMASATFLADKVAVSRVTSDWESWLWYGQVSESDISAAQRDFQIIVNGGSVGGGTGIIVGNQLAPSYQNVRQLGFKVGDTIYCLTPSYVKANPSTSVLASTITVSYPIDWFENVPTNAKDWDKVFLLEPTSGVSGSMLDFTCYLLKPGTYEWASSTFTYDGQTYTSYGFLSCSEPGYRYAGYVDGSDVQSGYNMRLQSSNYGFDGSNLSINFGSPNLRIRWAGQSASTSITSGNGWVGGVSTGGGGDGPNNWPEPTTPSPPDPTNPEPDPEPPTPPEFDPPGFDPDVPQPDPTPTPVGEPTNTTAADYTPWLRAILTALNVIIDDMGEHCDHIRVAMRDYLNGLYEALSDDLQAYYDDLTDYLSDLAKWIVSHLNFDIKQPDVNVNVPGYDDSSVIGWLRRIYYKLGGTSTPKPDPITETEDAFDWWQALLSWITNAVVGLLGEFVEDIDALLAFVRDKFPFSIPWDIAAYLALLDMQRQTPVVVFTIPEFEGAWDEYEIRIDLSAYDNAMSAVRTMVLIWWGMVLIMRTDWLLLLFDKQTGLAKGFVSRLTGISE